MSLKYVRRKDTENYAFISSARCKEHADGKGPTSLPCVPYLVAVVNVDSLQIIVCRQFSIRAVGRRFGAESKTTQ
jgi:hypothetical protein